MYAKLRGEVKEYITTELCKMSDEWVFSIDDTNENYPVIVGNGPNNKVIRTPIEKIHNYIPSELISSMLWTDIYDNDIPEWGGCFIIRDLVGPVFAIYKINKKFIFEGSRTLCVMNINNTTEITSYICGNKMWGDENVCFVSPFLDEDFRGYLMQEKLVSPLLLLLDPIKYFRRYSIIMGKYPELGKEHTWGIYEMLLEYFPEVNKEVIDKCLVVYALFWDSAKDVGGVIIDRIISLL